jgi:predicted MFS family arabinose efflux permease
MKVRFYPLLTVFSILFLLVATQAINGSLSLLSFERQQFATTVSSYDSVGVYIGRKIERGLALGKPLARFIGMEKLLKRAYEISGDLDNVAVTDSKGHLFTVLYDTEPWPGNVFQKSAKQRVYENCFTIGDNHFLRYALKGQNGDIAGFLVLKFSGNHLRERRDGIAGRSLTVLAWCTTVAALVLTCGFWFFFRFAGVCSRKNITFFLFIILGGAQLFCSLYNIGLFQRNYLDITRAKSKTIARLLQQDIDDLLYKGLKLTFLINIETRLNRVVAGTPELAWLAITDNRGKVLYRGGEVSVLDDKLITDIPLEDRNGAVGTLSVGLNGKVIGEAVREIGWDSLTLVGLSLLLVMEFVLLLFSTLLHTFVKKEKTEELSVHDYQMRAAVFLFIFASSLCYSFIPLHMDTIYRPLFGLSREVVLGMPLAFEMLGGGLVLIPAGWWIDRRGWHQPFLLGCGLTCLGMIFSAFAPGPLFFIAARTLTGVGYGLTWMSAQGFVLLKRDTEKRALAISNVVAGIYGGLICGNAIGALVAHRLGFHDVFLIGAVLLFALPLFVIFFLRKRFAVPEISLKKNKGEETGILELLTDPQALLMFLCSLMPYSVIAVGLLYYVVPVYLHSQGAVQSDIGRVIMLFGLCMIFIAPRVSRLADRMEDKRVFVYTGGFLASGSLLVFALSGSLTAVVFSVALFGLSVSISAASRNVIILGLPVSERLGSSRVMGVYRSVDKLGQTLGGIVPASLLACMELRSAMVVLGTLYMGLTFLLLFRLRDGAEQQ